ncbi:hypothetical protein KKA00_11785 [bacterium]|nr:hypothetical protein [bacterium]MBU1652895.1 hypothetical protein [bacterium]
MTTEPKKVIIIGGTGNGSVVAAAIDEANAWGDNSWQMAGYLNDRHDIGEEIEGYPVLGRLADVQTFIQQGYYFIYAIFRIDGQDKRMAMFEGLNIPRDRLATFIHPASYVAGNTEISPGCVIMPQASISSGARLGLGTVVMVNATVGHNSKIGKLCHIAAQACLGSYLQFGDGVHIGLNATIREGLILANRSTVAMGAVLLNDIAEDEIWAGVPAKFLRRAVKEFNDVE